MAVGAGAAVCLPIPNRLLVPHLCEEAPGHFGWRFIHMTWRRLSLRYNVAGIAVQGGAQRSVGEVGLVGPDLSLRRIHRPREGAGWRSVVFIPVASVTRSTHDLELAVDMEATLYIDLAVLGHGAGVTEPTLGRGRVRRRRRSSVAGPTVCLSLTHSPPKRRSVAPAGEGRPVAICAVTSSRLTLPDRRNIAAIRGQGTPGQLRGQGIYVTLLSNFFRYSMALAACDRFTQITIAEVLLVRAYAGRGGL